MNLKQSRENQGYSKADVARHLGVSEDTVKRWEKDGDPKIPLSKMALFCALYGIEPDVSGAKMHLSKNAPDIETFFKLLDSEQEYGDVWDKEVGIIPASARQEIEDALTILRKIYPTLIVKSRAVEIGRLLHCGSVEIKNTHKDFFYEVC